MIDITGTYTDQYQLTMAQVYYRKDRAGHPAVFDYFFRKPPFNGGYAVFAGLETLLDILEGLCFSDEDIRYLKESTNLDPAFVEFLKDFRFTGDITSAREGDLVFPTRPVLQVQAPILEAQIIETLMLNILNFQTLIATKAARIREMAGDKTLIDFGLRRAQGPAGYYASRAAVIGGFDATSNVRAGRDFGIPISGTMAHSFVQSYDNELTAFRDFAEERPDDCVLLLDTYSTLESGLPNAIKTGLEMKAKGHALKGVRLDSGDLAYLAREVRAALDRAGLEDVKIAASNQLDEFVIRSLNEQGAPIDAFGVGTKLMIGAPDGALDGVYKLSIAEGEPRLKLSETLEKITLPFKKQVYRLLKSNGDFAGGDVVCMEDESNTDRMYHPFDPVKSMPVNEFRKEPLLHPVMMNGKRTTVLQSLDQIKEFAGNRMQKLPVEYKRFENPHIYKIGLSTRLYHERQKLIDKNRGEVS